jgi:hypothetical protein
MSLSSRRTASSIAISALLAFASAGCNGAAAEERITVTLADLPPSAGPGAGDTWQSVGFTAEAWQPYPGATVLDLEHGLGRVPQAVLVYLSFEPTGAAASLAAGDLAQIVEVDETRVVVRNRTNADLFCRIVLE